MLVRRLFRKNIVIFKLKTAHIYVIITTITFVMCH